jgi:predicted nucleotidyltransferase
VRDPREGVASDGTIVTSVGAVAVPAAYHELLDDAATTLRQLIGEALHSGYLYGSVATGQARPPTSDLDLLVALVAPAGDGVARATSELGERHGHLVREVGISTVGVTTLARADAVGAAERCFLRHYCRHLVGPDLRAEFEPCRASIELAVGFNGDLAEALARLRSALTAAADPAERATAGARACRRILMAAATLLSAREGSWSTDRAEAVDLIGRHAPELRPLAADALTWAEPAAPPTGDVLAIVDRLGGWLSAAYARNGAS